MAILILLSILYLNTKQVLFMKSIALWAIAILLELYNVARLRKTMHFYRKLISNIKALDVLKVKELKNKVAEGLIKIGDFVLCQGRISAEGALKTVLGSPRKMAVYSDLVMDKVFEIGESRNTVRKSIRKLFTGILKLSDSEGHIKIFQTMGTNFLPTKFIKKTVSYRQKIFNFGWLISILLKSPTRVISNVYLQSYIPQNSETTVFTRILKNSLNEIEFSTPVSIAGSKQHMLAFYKDILQYNTYLSYALYLVIAVTLYFFYKTHIKPKLQANPPFFLVPRTGMSTIDKIQVKDLNCSICHAVLSNMIYSPCGHLNICDSCNVIKGEKQCLECNRKPREVVQVYPC